MLRNYIALLFLIRQHDVTPRASRIHLRLEIHCVLQQEQPHHNDVQTPDLTQHQRCSPPHHQLTKHASKPDYSHINAIPSSKFPAMMLT